MKQLIIACDIVPQTYLHMFKSSHNLGKFTLQLVYLTL